MSLTYYMLGRQSPHSRKVLRVWVSATSFPQLTPINCDHVHVAHVRVRYLPPLWDTFALLRDFRHRTSLAVARRTHDTFKHDIAYAFIACSTRESDPTSVARIKQAARTQRQRTARTQFVGQRLRGEIAATFDSANPFRLPLSIR